MRINPIENPIFDTQVDTIKIFVPMKHSFKLRDYVDSSGKSPLYLHVTQKGDRERIFLDIYITPSSWNKSKGEIIIKTPGDSDNDLLLKNIEANITEIKTNYRLSGIFLSLEKFKEEFSNGWTRRDLLSFMSYQLELDKPEMADGTYKNQKKVINKLRKFKSSIFFSEIDQDFLKKFKNHIINSGNAATTMNNSLKVLKKYLFRAEARAIKFPLNPKEIVCGPTSGNRVDLDGLEINKLISLFYSEFIDRTHIVPLAKFLISCFTGLRISDVQQLSHVNIVNERLRFTAIKTGKRQIIALNITVRDILEECPEALTSTISDKHINTVLKVVSKICGIKKNVTFHVARHSFATNYLRLGGKVEILQQILGHSNINETMIYVHIVQEEQDREIMIMDQLVDIKPTQVVSIGSNNDYWQSNSQYVYGKTGE